MLGHFAGADHGLHTGYTFTFLEDRTFKPRCSREHYEFLDGIEGLWPCVTFSNHDVPRTVTRYGRTMEADPALAKLALALLMTLKGTVLLYQGEELGLPDGPIERHQIRDPVGELYFPYSKGRDPCRTPMPWVAGKPNLGFSYGEPWLPMAPAHAALAANKQEHDKDSVLWFARALGRAAQGSIRRWCWAICGCWRRPTRCWRSSAFVAAITLFASSICPNPMHHSSAEPLRAEPLLTVGDVQQDGGKLEARRAVGLHCEAQDLRRRAMRLVDEDRSSAVAGVYVAVVGLLYRVSARSDVLAGSDRARGAVATIRCWPACRRSNSKHPTV